MNDLKFRAWDKKDKVMRIVYGVLFKRVSNKGNRANDIVELHCSDYEGQRAIILSHFERPLEDIELMQFTGLKDKNGKEIYEGDIVLSKHRSSGFTKSEVIFNKGCFLVDGFYIDAIWDVPLEVIGNIYENPELFKEVKE